MVNKLKIKKIDVIKVYPTEDGLYFGRKWALIAYELSRDIKGVMDVPLPKECDSVHPVAISAINGIINRGTYDNVIVPDYKIVA